MELLGLILILLVIYLLFIQHQKNIELFQNKNVERFQDEKVILKIQTDDKSKIKVNDNEIKNINGKTNTGGWTTLNTYEINLSQFELALNKINLDWLKSYH